MKNGREAKKRQYQGSKTAARKAAYLEREAKREGHKRRQQRIDNARTVEELAAAMGIPLN